jgi:hypothetical protein
MTIGMLGRFGRFDTFDMSIMIGMSGMIDMFDTFGMIGVIDNEHHTNNEHHTINEHHPRVALHLHALQPSCFPMSVGFRPAPSTERRCGPVAMGATWLRVAHGEWWGGAGISAGALLLYCGRPRAPSPGLRH